MPPALSGSARSSRWTARRTIVDLVATQRLLRAALSPAAAARQQPRAARDAAAVHDRVLRGARRPAFATRMPHASIGSDIIVGFPGETDDDFECSRRYLERSPLTHVHVFPYSDRPGTPAAAMPDKVAWRRSSANALAGCATISEQLSRAVPRVAGRDGSSRADDRRRLAGGDGKLSEGQNSAGPRRGTNGSTCGCSESGVPLTGELVWLERGPSAQSAIAWPAAGGRLR